MKPYGQAGRAERRCCSRHQAMFKEGSRTGEVREAFRHESAANGDVDLPHWPWLGPPQWPGLDWEALPDWHPDAD